MKWVLVLVAFSGGDFETKMLGGYDTVAQCHVATTEIFWGEKMPINEGIVCMRIEK